MLSDHGSPGYPCCSQKVVVPCCQQRLTVNALCLQINMQFSVDGNCVSFQTLGFGVLQFTNICYLRPSGTWHKHNSQNRNFWRSALLLTEQEAVRSSKDSRYEYPLSSGIQKWWYFHPNVDIFGKGVIYDLGMKSFRNKPRHIHDDCWYIPMLLVISQLIFIKQ